MCMGIDEPRKYAPSTKINFLAQPGREAQHFVIRADRENTTSADGQCLRAGNSVIHGPDVAIVKDQLRFHSRNRRHREGSQAIQEITPGESPNNSDAFILSMVMKKGSPATF